MLASLQGLTTFGASLIQLCRAALARFSFHARSQAERRQIGPILVGPRLRWHYRFLYLRTLRQELCNVYHRMEIVRNRHLCQIGTSLLPTYEGALLSHPARNKLIRARILGIRKLRSNLPTATLADLHLLIESLHPDLFEEDQNRVARCLRRMGIRPLGRDTKRFREWDGRGIQSQDPHRHHHPD